MVKTIFVSDPIHRKLKVLSAQRGVTLQELANLLLTQALTIHDSASTVSDHPSDQRHSEVEAVRLWQQG